MPRARFEIGFGGALYVVVASLVLGAAMYTQTNLLFWSFGLMVGGFLSSIVLPWLMLRGVTVERLSPGYGVAGQRMVLRYHLVNPRRWSPTFNLVIRERWKPLSWRQQWRAMWGVKVHDDDRPTGEDPPRLMGEPAGWVLHLGAGQVIQAEAPCWPMRRGTLNFEKVELSTTFPFGIIRRVLTFDLPGEVLVYPRLYRMNRRVLHRLSQTDPAGSRRLDQGGGAEEFYGLRPHRPGDSLKTIDWKHSARLGELIVREMTRPTPPRVMVLLDLSVALEQNTSSADDGADTAERSIQDDPIERAVSLAATLVCDAHFQGYQIGLAVRGASVATLPPHHSLPHRTRLLETLAELVVTPDAAAPSGLMMEPSVVIQPGPTRRLPGLGRAMVLGADDLEQYVEPSADGGERLLQRRTHTPTRRQQVTNTGDAA